MVRASILLLFLVFAHVALAPYAEDDAYIHLRVARNIWESATPFFNHSDPVQSSTSLVWLGVLTCFEALGVSSIRTLALCNAVLTFFAVLAWSSIIRTALNTRFSTVETVLVDATLLGSMAPGSFALMETPLALLLVALGIRACSNRSMTAVALFALATWTRPEACLLSLPFLAGVTKWPPAESIRAIFGGGIVVTVCLLVQLLCFDSVIAHTMSVKSSVYDISFPEFLKIFAMASTGERLTIAFLPVYCIATLIICLRFILAANCKIALPWHNHSIEVACGVGSALIFFSYALAGVPVFQWYVPLVLTPLTASLCLLAVRGTIRRSSWIILGSATLAVAISVAMAAIVDIRFYPWINSGARVQRYLEIGKAMQMRCPHSVIGAPEIGGLGWEFPGTILDGVGLATSSSGKFHPMKVPNQRSAGYLGAFPAGLLQEHLPDAIIGPPILLEEVLRSPSMERYTVVRCPPYVGADLDRLGNSLWGGTGQFVIIRRDSKCSADGFSLCGTL